MGLIPIPNYAVLVQIKKRIEEIKPYHFFFALSLVRICVMFLKKVRFRPLKAGFYNPCFKEVFTNGTHISRIFSRRSDRRFFDAAPFTSV
ncbi:hypothetical protein CWI74_18655 [Bacillus velezensis]|nr:hypothetical protein CJP14_03825 [Bacillus velezensis]OPD46266.1 hypothetical protein BVF98_01465 [Bacillus amyloliquefaciens]AWM82613.1 hypothetical protein B7L90_04855 [Bacillus velezensis]PAE35145.1 hypothetical protein CHI00_03605 [Bacillus velezensis]PAE78201.1 hypothetical protein CHH82_01470 [Bacillus velezensis]